jgi:hypothetical protein
MLVVNAKRARGVHHSVVHNIPIGVLCSLLNLFIKFLLMVYDAELYE